MAVYLFNSLLFLVLLPASLYDIYKYKVPNAVIICGIACGVGKAYVADGVSGVATRILYSMLALCVMFVFYKLRMFGAGDVKLLFVVFLNVGWRAGWRIVVISLLIGAIVSIYKMVSNGIVFARFQYFFDYINQILQDKKLSPYNIDNSIDKKAVVPFALCISIGVATNMILGL